MLSNLVKQFYVTTDPDNSGPMIINSNDRVAACMKSYEEEQARLQEAKMAEESAGDAEFREGLILETVDGEVYRGEGNPEGESSPVQAAALDGPTYDEIVAKANEEAERILGEARMKADQIMNEANQNGKIVFEEQKQAGYQAGEAQVQEELETARRELEAQFAKQSQQLQQDYQIRLGQMESDIIDAIIQVFDHVFHIQFEDRREILLYLVNNTIQNISSGKHFKIFSASENLPFLEENLPALREKLGSNVEVELMYDAALSSDGCRIETEYGVFDCGIDTELANIYKDIRSLCG